MDSLLQHLWPLKFFMRNGTLSAFLLMSVALLLKCLLISAYFSFLYGGIWCVKKFCRKKMSVQANYYCWYILFASIILANLEANDYFKELLYGALFASEVHYAPLLYLARCLLLAVWLLVAARKLTAHIMLNRKIQKSFKYMERSDYGEHLARQAANVLGLRERITVLAANCIDSPLSYGIFKKVILLPGNFKDKYSAHELYLLILHETAHIKNGDTVKLHLISLVECFLWFTPVMRLFGKHFKRDAEILCDNRVLGVKGVERDTYASLILKECAVRNTLAGLAFSDSYHALENRLDALYRHKPEKYGHATLAAVTVALLLLICASYQMRTDNYLAISGDYNSKFEIAVVSTDFMSYEFLDPVICSGVYEIVNDTIRIDKIALDKLTRRFAGREYEWVYLSSNNFNMKINEFYLSGSVHYRFHFDELAGIAENNRYLSERLEKRPLADYLFLRLADFWL